MNQPIRMGIIGCGHAGLLHAQAIRKLNHLFSLVAIADINLKTTANAKERVYQDYLRLLSDPEVDAISICTRPCDHYNQAFTALRTTRKHVLVEKPPAFEIGQCQELAQLAKEKDVSLYLSHHTAMIPAVAAARELLAGRKVTRVDALHLDQAGKLHAPTKWTFDPMISGGGALMDCGINIMSAVMEVVPAVPFIPTRVRLSGPSTLKVETRVEADFRLGDGGFGHLTMDWESPVNVRRICFTMSDGEIITIDTVRGRLFRDGAVVPGFEQSTNSLTEEYPLVYQDFARHIANGRSYVNTRPLQFVLEAYNLAKRTR